MRIETPSLKRLVQNLTHLSELVLDDVSMFSVPPNSFMNLSSSLTSLHLFGCGLKGRFPDKIFHLPNLQLLDVSLNYNLTGSLPTYNWSTPLMSLGSHPTFLPNLTQITSLDLSQNNFGGQIPWSLLNFEGLTYLNLLDNNFIGQLPEVTTNLTQIFSSNNSSNSQLVNKIPSNLEYLILSSNLLNGTIPSWVYTIPSLRHLLLDYNQFTGHIGDFQHNSLVSLWLDNNNLRGPLPLSISKLVSLHHLSVPFNNLSGNVESKIFSKLKSLILPKIASLKLSSSNITEIPHFLQTAEYIQILDLSKNQIKGNIPKWFLEVGKDLYSLNLSYNSLTSIGHLPWKNLHVLDLSHNFLQGPLPIPPSRAGKGIRREQVGVTWMDRVPVRMTVRIRIQRKQG
ncbi:receptor-like protein 9dc2 [Quercus suber]|uniref:Receptor-like protein 9dc2 n=1 Tax=Quercus suber TaxID=58331 RepID=A0AAW0L466_QUESU